MGQELRREVAARRCNSRAVGCRMPDARCRMPSTWPLHCYPHMSAPGAEAGSRVILHLSGFGSGLGRSFPRDDFVRARRFRSASRAWRWAGRGERAIATESDVLWWLHRRTPRQYGHDELPWGDTYPDATTHIHAPRYATVARISTNCVYAVSVNGDKSRSTDEYLAALGCSR